MITNNNKKPLISIVVCTYNSHQTIIDTLKSIKKQSYKNYQVIIVDKNSIDNTLSIIKNFKIANIKITKLSRGGLYNAINKGIILSNGDIISILHSDDFFYDKFVLQNVAKVFANKQIDIVYGDLLYVKKNDKTKILRYWKTGIYKKKSFFKGWSPPHPTFFCSKKTYLKGKLYKTNIGNSSDVELMYRYLEIIGFRFKYLKKILVVMRYGGISNNSVAGIISQNISILKFLKIHKKPFRITIFFLYKLVSRFFQFLNVRKFNVF